MSEKTPASQMIRVPTALVTAVKELSTLHRQGHTKAILQALQELIASLGSSAAISESGSDSSVVITESVLDSSKVIADILERLAVLEDRVEAMQEQPSRAKTGKTLPVDLEEKIQSHPVSLLQNQQPIAALDINACPQCQSTKLSRWGKDKRGIKQRFKCKDCGKIFVS